MSYLPQLPRLLRSLAVSSAQTGAGRKKRHQEILLDHEPRATEAAAIKAWSVLQGFGCTREAF